MTDMDDEVRRLLQGRADDVPPHRQVPQSLVGRTRLRIALNGLVLGVTVVVLGAGAFAGVRALGGSGASRPVIGNGTTTSTQPTPSASASGTGTCTSAQLRALASMEGAAGSREGAIALTNFSKDACTLEGTPTITLLDQNLTPITSDISFLPSDPAWVVNHLPQPPGWPLVTLAPGDAASVRIRWGNWCPQGRAAPRWRMDIPGGETVDVDGLQGVVHGTEGDLGPPPCNGQGQPSTIEVGPFEPGPTA